VANDGTEGDAVKSADSSALAAGEYAYQKYRSEMYVKKYIGEKKYNDMTDNQKFALASLFFNARKKGEKALKEGGSSVLEESLRPYNPEKESSDDTNAHRNIKIREYIYLDSKPFFTFP